jgi:pyridoxine 5-phosphate synthase
MLKLGVNIDHVATLREARYRGRDYGEPDPVEAAELCEEAGAHGITAHLREDRRHILDRDILALRARVRTRLNLEMALAPEIIQIALQVKPDIVCLVPERRQEVTTEGGLDVAQHTDAVAEVCRRMSAAGIQASLFISPEPRQIRAAARTGSQFVELHTGAFAERAAAGSGVEAELRRLSEGAELAKQLGLRINAGHGLNLANLGSFLARVPHLEELNIGHSLVSHAVFVGLAASVREFLEALRGYGLGPS